MTILTKDQLIKDIEAMISKVADEHGLTYDELLQAWAVSEGGVVVNKEKNHVRKRKSARSWGC